jgi:hypothetical protein
MDTQLVNMTLDNIRPTDAFTTELASSVMKYSYLHVLITLLEPLV